MAIAAANTLTKVTAPDTAQTYGPALAVLTTLFFIWGSLTSLNDVLIPFAQNAFNLNLAASFLIQTAFFLAYFIFSIPSAKIIDWIGYKRAIIVGLSTMVAACLLVYPTAKIPSFPFFLTALLILAAGITVLQVAANPPIVGGAAIPWIVGKVADAINHAYYPTTTHGELSWGQGIHYALIIATFCYLYILFFAVSGSKPNSERYAKG
jgi:fucose permease